MTWYLIWIKLGCKNNQFECEDGDCIPISWTYDGDNDCEDGGDGSDEGKCFVNIKTTCLYYQGKISFSVGYPFQMIIFRLQNPCSIVWIV